MVRFLNRSAIAMAIFLYQGHPLRIFHTASAPTSQRSLSRLHSSTENKSKRSENIDIFAAPSKKLTPPPPPITTPNPSSEPKNISNLTLFVPSTTSVSKSFADRVSSGKEIQVELLRLEAEKEQVEIDMQRLESEKARLINIDRALRQYLEDGNILTLLNGQFRSAVSTEMFLRLVELISLERDSVEQRRLISLYDTLVEDLQRLEPPLHADIMESLKKSLSLEESERRAERLAKSNKSGSRSGAGSEVKSYEEALASWVRQTMSGLGDNITASVAVSGDAEGDVEGENGVDDFGVNLYRSEDVVPPSEGANGLNVINGLPTMIRFPASLPTVILPLIFRATPIIDQDIKCLKSSVFSPDLMANVTVESSPFITIFRGVPVNGQSFESIYNEIKTRVELLSSPVLNFDKSGTEVVSSGMKERIKILALPEYPSSLSPAPATPGSLMMEKYSGVSFSPVFIVISSGVKPRQPGLVERVANVLTLVAAAVTTMIYSTDVYSMNKVFVDQVMAGDLDTLDRVLALAVSILGVQAAHDLGHRIAASWHKLSISLPFLLPSLQIGIFGSITNILDFPKTRTQLFDVALAGPLLGFLASLALTITGLTITQSASPAELATYPAIPTGFFSSSFFLYQLTDLFLHTSSAIEASISAAASAVSQGQSTGTSAAQALASSVTSIHPFVAAGIIGLITNAFNFMPIGRLDGGRVSTAVFGRKSAQTLSTLTLIAQAASLLVESSPIGIFWILLVVFLQRGQELPPEDDITPVGSENSAGPAYYGRMAAFVFCVILAASMLIPMPLDLSSLTPPSSGLPSAHPSTLLGTPV